MAVSIDRPNRTRRLLTGVAVAFGLAAAACGDGEGAVSDPATNTAAASTTAAPTTTGPAVDCSSVPRGMTEFVLDAGGAEHPVRVYVPTTFDGSSEWALVLNFHGFSSNGDQQAAVSGYDEFAEHEGFIVVHPTAVPSTGSSQETWELADFDDPAKDDLAFTNALLDLLVEDYCVDESRIYATGMSGGGLFTSSLVCDMSDRLAAASSVAALTHSDGCDPARAVPYMAIHGTADDRVPFDGDVSKSLLAGASFADELLTRVIPEEFAQFADTMGCDPEGERVQQSTDIVTTTYSGCDDGVPLVFHEVVNGGHTWPNTPLAERLTAFQGYITSEIDATADSWAFFEQHTLES